MAMLTIEQPSNGTGGGGGGRLKVPGDYLCIVESLIRKTGPKADYYSCCFRVVSKVQSGDSGFDPSCAGAYFYEIMSLSPKAQWRIGKLAYFLGHDAGATIDLDNQESVEDFICDREVVVNVSVEDDGRGYGARAKWTGDGRRISTKEKSELGSVYDSKGEPYNEAWRPESNDSSWGESSGSSGSKGGPKETDAPF